ncbi:MAG: 7-cyano-7-deazaguanine synthase QueC [Candidatus Thermoplasmatota archaeon]|nr:7-cyano-7-deazaguanine synthase QueC [Candidatus Thermoplasmatota archaeon]
MLKAVVLLSGGIDSSTTMAIAGSMGYECYALTIRYGQIHDREVMSARNIAVSLKVKEHRVIELPEGMFTGSALLGDGEIPLDRDVGSTEGIPDTYVPARNLIFLSIASGWAEVLDADAVFIGATAMDYSGYPDCRPEFLRSFQSTLDLATRKGVQGGSIKVLAPLLDLKKSMIIQKGIDLGLDLSLTWSCYQGGEKACGRCDSCLFRLRGFKELGLKDPVKYEKV